MISGKGNINISASWIMSNSNVDLHAGNDITLGHTGTSSTGTWIQSNGVMSVSANNLTLYGGSTGIFNISGSQGPGAMLYSAGSQTVTVVNQILLRAGSANNTNPMYGGGTSSGSVGIWSDADQTISANVIKLWAGVSGHDNGAELRAYHDQAINITGTGGLLELKGGGDNSGAVYGGAGSYNNQARIQHGQWVSNDSYTGSGNQIITIDGGGTVNVQAGGGTGVLGYYSNECASATGNPNLCRGSSNGATIENGIGAQTLDYVAGGTLTVTGGSAGTQNWAGVNNKGAGQYIYGNPNITLTGGTGGGAVSYGGEIFNLSNDAGIYSKGSGAQYIYGGSITINAGGDAASYGGAGISNDSGQGLYISTTGTLAMYGGASSAGDIFAGGAYIGNKNGGAIDLQIGGALYIKAGSGTSSPILIGSVDGPGNVNIRTTGNADIIADGSGVAIGSLSASYGATVSISSGGSLTVSGSATRGVLIGSLFDSDAGSIDGNGIAVGSSSRLSANSNLSLLSRNDISIKDTATVKTYGGAITLVAGWDGSMAPVVNRPGSITAYGGFTTDGGAFTAYAGNSIMLGSINTDGVSNYYGYSGGNVNLRADAGFIDVSSISAKGSVPIGSGNSGGWGGSVTLQSFGGLT
ncbi:MAG: hypothetical protein NTW45_00180, partial [Rhodocyclales bacterium]|nr:hypothetical protein [Rhodocyclales bacterium]